MIRITDTALEFIKKSLKETGDDNLGLRIAVHPDKENNCYNYGVGFDQEKPHDIMVNISDIKIFLHEKQKEVLEDSTMDYVRMEDGSMNLIIMNPNDPSYVPPKIKQ